MFLWTHLVRLGANPYHTRQGTLPVPGTPTVRIFSPVSDLIMLYGHDDDQIVPNRTTSWIAYICPDGGYVNLLIMRISAPNTDCNPSWEYGVWIAFCPTQTVSTWWFPTWSYWSSVETFHSLNRSSYFVIWSYQGAVWSGQFLPTSVLGLKDMCSWYTICAKDMPLVKFPMKLEMKGRKCMSRFKQSNKNSRSSRPIPAWADHIQIHNAGLLDVDVHLW